MGQLLIPYHYYYCYHYYYHYYYYLIGGIPTPLKNDGVRQIGSSSQL